MTVYTETARFDTGRALTETEMRRLAPSIFAMSAHESRSERFKPIPTIEVLRGLAAEGFVVVGAKQSASRTKGKADFTKHLIRLRRVDDGETYRVGDTVCEILLKNANDGTSAYELLAGLFRVRCLNSLVTQTAPSMPSRSAIPETSVPRSSKAHTACLTKPNAPLPRHKIGRHTCSIAMRSRSLPRRPMSCASVTATATPPRRSSRNNSSCPAAMTIAATTCGPSGTRPKKM